MRSSLLGTPAIFLGSDLLIPRLKRLVRSFEAHCKSVQHHEISRMHWSVGDARSPFSRLGMRGDIDAREDDPARVAAGTNGLDAYALARRRPLRRDGLGGEVQRYAEDVGIFGIEEALVVERVALPPQCPADHRPSAKSRSSSSRHNPDQGKVPLDLSVTGAAAPGGQALAHALAGDLMRPTGNTAKVAVHLPRLSDCCASRKQVICSTRQALSRSHTGSTISCATWRTSR